MFKLNGMIQGRKGRFAVPCAPKAKPPTPTHGHDGHAHDGHGHDGHAHAHEHVHTVHEVANASGNAAEAVADRGPYRSPCCFSKCRSLHLDLRPVLHPATFMCWYVTNPMGLCVWVGHGRSQERITPHHHTHTHTHTHT